MSDKRHDDDQADDLADLTKGELLTKAAAYGIEGRSGMNKDELAAAIRDHERRAPVDAGKDEKPRTEDAAAAEAARPSQRVATRQGRLYAAEPGRLSLLGRNDTAEGDVLKLHEEPDVQVNGKPATLADLRRGDHVFLQGDPVDTVVASR